MPEAPECCPKAVSLVDIISMDGIPLASTMIQGHVFHLRLVSREVKIALEYSLMRIKIRINDAGVENLTARFLQRWHGQMHLECTHPCTTDSRWFKEAILSARLRPLNLLSLSVDGENLYSVVETLGETGTAIQQLEINYCGDGSYFLAASAFIASLGNALTMRISVEGLDPGGRQATVWLQCLVASSVRINSLCFRSAC